MLIVTAILKRSSPDIFYFPQTEDWQTRWNAKIENAMSVGWLTKPENFRVESEDRLTLTMITHWRSIVDNSNFLCDMEVNELNEMRDIHFQENQIQVEFKKQVIADEYDQG